jgi:glycosyltransferase involved in cell wall biosynthesis
MSLPYFADYGWDAEIATVDEKYSDLAKDELLLQSVPPTIKIHKVKAFNKSWTSKLGLGSIALRSLWYYRKKVNQLLKTGKFDLVYFSTTQFPVCILGAYWKAKFNVPYIIDMQDPWHTDYYQYKPKHQRPNKYWLSYPLNKFLEPIAMKKVDGLISVSESYIHDLKKRYPEIKNIPAATITFGAFEPDMKIAIGNQSKFANLLNPAYKSIVYIGRGGSDLHKAITPFFEVLASGIKNEQTLYSKLKIYFIGTSYAAQGQGILSIIPLAKQYNLENSVIEITDRISYYHTLATLLKADGLFIPGSDDPAYTASKIYPYLLTNKPLLAIFNSLSPAINILQEYGVAHTYSYDKTADINAKISAYLQEIMNGSTKAITYHADAIKKYDAENMTLQQCSLFNRVIDG